MHRRDVQLILFLTGLVLSVLLTLSLWTLGIKGFWVMLLFPVFLWPFGLRH